MATIDLTVTRSPHVAGGLRIVIGNYVGPASYATNGDALVPGDVGLGDIEFIVFSTTLGGNSLVYNYATGKAVWLTGAGVEVTALTALNTQVSRFMAVGK
jgi:hypothetical protein